MLGNRLFKGGVICMFLQTFNTRISNRGAHKLLDLTSKGDGFRILGQIEKCFANFLPTSVSVTIEWTRRKLINRKVDFKVSGIFDR